MFSNVAELLPDIRQVGTDSYPGIKYIGLDYLSALFSNVAELLLYIR